MGFTVWNLENVGFSMFKSVPAILDVQKKNATGIGEDKPTLWVSMCLDPTMGIFLASKTMTIKALKHPTWKCWAQQMAEHRPS